MTIPTDRIVWAQKKPIRVRARQVSAPGECQTAHGPIPYSAGDWIITDPNSNDSWPVRDEIFMRTYEIS